MGLPASVVLDKWSANTKGSTQSYVAGVRATQSNPGELAAQAADKYAEGCREAVASGRYQEGCRSVSAAQWKDACEKTGAPRISSGVDKGKAKMQVFLAEFLPQQEAITQQVKAMPSATLDQRLDRMVAQARLTSQIRIRGRR